MSWWCCMGSQGWTPVIHYDESVSCVSASADSHGQCQEGCPVSSQCASYVPAMQMRNPPQQSTHNKAFTLWDEAVCQIVMHSAPEPVQEKKNVTKGLSMDSFTNIYIKLDKLRPKIFGLRPNEIENF